MDGNAWISCDRCEKWTHPDCEILHGKDPKYKEAAEKLKAEVLAEQEAELAAAANSNAAKLGDDTLASG